MRIASAPRVDRRPPKGVAVVENRTGRGSWLAKWVDPKSKKTQYAYERATIVARRGEMFARNLELGRQHKNIVTKYRRDLRGTDERRRIVAAMIALVDQACFRPGSGRSLDGHFGLTTLRAEHVSVDGDRMTFTYVGKAGVEQRRIVTDKRIATIVEALLEDTTPNAPLFAHGGRPIRPEELNAYLPPGLTVKMFRSFHATRIAAKHLIAARVRFGRTIPERERPAILRDVYETVASHLGNTPAICKTSYVDPAVVRAICEGEDR